MFRRKRTYLDWAAAAPASSVARHAFLSALPVFGNPSSPHEDGRKSRALLEDARTRIARLASVKPDAVIFTSGATEANALLIEGHINALIARGKLPKDIHVLYLASAHASTQGAVERLKEKGVVVEPVALSDMRIDLDTFKTQLRPETALVCLERVCGETGIRFDTRSVRRVLDAAGSAAVLHVDASQAPFEEEILLTRMGADTVSLDAQKVGGVRGVGVLIAPRRIPILPRILGGGQERGLRPGTESPALACAFASALETLEPHTFTTRARMIREEFLATILPVLSGAVINEGKDQAHHILNISLPGRDTDYLVALLSEAGFSVSTKSACETGEEGSRPLVALTGDAARAASTLRISWGPSTTRQELLRFADALVSAVRFMDRNQVY